MSAAADRRPVPKPPPARRLAPVVPIVAALPGVDPQLLVAYWNHCCPHPGCMVWVPNHRRGCAEHGGHR